MVRDKLYLKEDVITPKEPEIGCIVDLILNLSMISCVILWWLIYRVIMSLSQWIKLLAQPF
jgi:hypothetical protein